MLLSTLAFSRDLYEVAPEIAVKHLQKAIEPIPLDTQFSLIRGDVVLQLQISESGTVTSIQAVSGHPLLIDSAITAVRKWVYRPFLLNGKPVAVKTSVTVPFYPPQERGETLRDNARSDLFFKTFDLCRDLINSRQLVDAEATCTKATALSLLLNDSQQLERMDALKEAGHAFFLQKKFSEALDNYEAELRVGEKILQPFNAELASAQHDVGNGLWGTGRLEDASLRYAKAEDGYKHAATQIESAFLKNEYAKKLKLVLSDHAAMLRQMGRPSEADSLEKEAAAIIVKEGLRNQ